jgi:hypothetical protein
MAKIDPTRLYTALLNTGLQNKDNPLYQVIHDLIGILANINKQTNTLSGSSGSTSIIQQTVIQLSDFVEGDAESWPIFPPPLSDAEIDAFIPYFIGPTETFSIPINKQGLFSMNIDNEGILIVDGFLIEVDGGSSSLSNSQGIPGLDGDFGEDSFIPGPPGPSGPSGIQGINGINGMIGPPGIDGESSESQDWLSVPLSNITMAMIAARVSLNS